MLFFWKFSPKLFKFVKKFTLFICCKACTPVNFLAPVFFLQPAKYPYTQQESEFRSSRRTYKKNWYCDIFTYTYTKQKLYTILILEVPDFMAAAPELNQFMLEFDLGRLCGMTLYEILSLAIDLAILILAALSYLKDRKS